MSYYANGSGTITFKPGTTEDEINLILDKYFDYHFDDSELWTDQSVNRVVLDFNHHENYHGEVIDDLLRDLSPFVESGELDFIGEDNSMWRFRFDGEGFEEENGDVIFESDAEHNVRFKKALVKLLEKEAKDLNLDDLYRLSTEIGLTDDDLTVLGFDYFIPRNVL